MRRTELPEIHDLPSFPQFLRDFVTDALQVLWSFGNSYRPMLPYLNRSLRQAGTAEVVDLCSGGGGPWASLSRQLEQEYALPVRVHLTDKFPNQAGLNQLHTTSHPVVDAKVCTCKRSRIDFVPESVDAKCLPRSLRGFRTMFSSFHHFGPEQARDILLNAVEERSGIAIFEAANRDLKTWLVLCVTPLLVLFLTPSIRPFRWSRLFWTYLIPVVPFVIWIDGWVSCLRTYSLDELQELVDELKSLHSGSDYSWEIGKDESGLLPITYLIGAPVSASNRETQ